MLRRNEGVAKLTEASREETGGNRNLAIARAFTCLQEYASNRNHPQVRRKTGEKFIFVAFRRFITILVERVITLDWLRLPWSIITKR